jgi:phosphate:Na+ symporter
VAIAILSGVIITILLDSSSVTIIMVIALINAGLVSFHRALGVIMGANIGTTISSQLFVLNVGEYSAILLLAGFVVYFFTKKKFLRYGGLVLFGFGLIFLGLDMMGHAVEPLKDHEQLTNWLISLESPLKGVFFGALLTVIIQSSSATMGIVITLASQQMISLAGGIAVMLGAEIGTCADTLMASIGRSRDAIRAGVFHLGFNIVSVVIGLIFYRQLASLAVFLSPDAGAARHVANAHVLFNISGVLLFAWFTSPIANVLKRIVPGKSPQLQHSL